MLTPPDPPAADYLCRRPLLTHSSMTGRATLCMGKMRLRDAALDELPGLTLTMRLLVCETCGRTALPEDHASS